MSEQVFRLSRDNDGGLEASIDTDGRVVLQNATDAIVSITPGDLSWLMVAAGPAIPAEVARRAKVRPADTAAVDGAPPETTEAPDGQTSLDEFAVANAEGSD